MTKRRKTFTPEFKIEAVRLLKRSDRSQELSGGSYLVNLGGVFRSDKLDAIALQRHSVFAHSPHPRGRRNRDSVSAEGGPGLRLRSRARAGAAA
jgi:hypothetical protein